MACARSRHHPGHRGRARGFHPPGHAGLSCLACSCPHPDSTPGGQRPHLPAWGSPGPAGMEAALRAQSVRRGSRKQPQKRPGTWAPGTPGAAGSTPREDPEGHVGVGSGPLGLPGRRAPARPLPGCLSLYAAPTLLRPQGDALRGGPSWGAWGPGQCDLEVSAGLRARGPSQHWPPVGSIPVSSCGSR